MTIENNKIWFDSFDEAIEFKIKLNEWLSLNSPLSLSLKDEPEKVNEKYCYNYYEWMEEGLKQLSGY